MPTLRRITVFPIKSLDGCDVTEARVLPGGALELDRRWAIFDGQGRVVNGKRTPAIHAIRAAFDETLSTVRLARDARGSLASSHEFHLPGDSSAVAEWLSEALGLKCRLVENADDGFPDDTIAPGPTLISTASLAAVAAWFPGLDVTEMRRRIRSNLEFDAPEAFWEDRLADDGLQQPRFSIGKSVYRGRTICARCVVPTRDSQTGEAIAGFARAFADRRAAELPAWSPAEQFNHFYRLAINTAPEWIEDDAVLRIGDEFVVT
ncbi:MAG: MOSC N-terminal beta barrel domain-containing protein [Pirellulales bacterium]|nr:MOSC N-terminal beta barrel domain-containing protein [Pirellulales bacterium]